MTVVIMPFATAERKVLGTAQVTASAPTTSAVTASTNLVQNPYASVVLVLAVIGLSLDSEHADYAKRVGSDTTALATVAGARRFAAERARGRSGVMSHLAGRIA
jgi:hypothetical protein